MDETPPPTDLQPVTELVTDCTLNENDIIVDDGIENDKNEQSADDNSMSKSSSEITGDLNKSQSGDSGSDNRDYDSTSEGSSVVKTKLPPGKVSEICNYFRKLHA